MHVGVVGATGQVGGVMLAILAERSFPVTTLRCFASARSAGSIITWQGRDIVVEDAATAEISRTQVWQWVRHRATLEDGSMVTAERVRALLAEELDALRAAQAPATLDPARLQAAADLFLEVATGERLVDFLTVPAYAQLVTVA